MSAKPELHKTHTQEVTTDDGRTIALLSLYQALSNDQELPILQATMTPDFKHIDDMTSMYQGLNSVVTEKIGPDTAFLHHQDITVIRSVDQLKGLMKTSDNNFMFGLLKTIGETQSVTEFWRGNLSLFAYSYSGDNRVIGMMMALATGLAARTARIGKPNIPVLNLPEKPSQERIFLTFTNAKASNELYLNALISLLADESGT